MSNSQNINSHYTNNPKVELTRRVASAPQNMQTNKVLNRDDVKVRMQNINQDIYEGTQSQKNKSKKTFWTVFGGIVLAIIGYRCIRKLFK